MGGSTDPRLARPSWRGRANVDALTIACIEHAERLGGHEFVCTQGSYQAGAGDPNSAGTHDLGGVVDLRWCGHYKCLVALREAGMAAWLRTPAQGPWPHHIHAVVIGHPYLAASAARQVQSYLGGRNGLANNARDDGPRLDPIPRPVWPWPPEEDDMPAPSEWTAEDWKVIGNKIGHAVWSREFGGDSTALLLQWAGRNSARLNTRLGEQMAALREAVEANASPADVKRLLNALDATIQLVVNETPEE